MTRSTVRACTAVVVVCIAISSAIGKDDGKDSIGKIDATPEGKSIVDGMKRGLVSRYFDVCQPWRGHAAMLDTLDRNDIAIYDPEGTTAELAMHATFDEFASYHSRKAACRMALDNLKKYGVKLF